MTCYRMFEILMLVLINNLPYTLLLIVYPFRDSFRFSNRITYLVLTLIMATTFAKECAVEMYNIPAHISTIFTAITGFGSIFIMLKARPGKILMMQLLAMNFSIIPLYLGKYTEGLLFYENSLQQFRLTHTLFIFLWEIPLFYGLKKYLDRIVVPIMKRSKGEKIWSYLWTIPTTFFLIWNAYLAQFPYYAEAPLANRTVAIMMILFISAGSMVIYNDTFMLLNERIKNENAAAQYKRLTSNIDEARKARHDIRHHLVMIDSYLKDEKYDEVRDYLEQYKLSLPREEALTFCENYVINSILTYTKQQANMMGTECEIKVHFPSDIPITDQDLTIIIGNLLENALDACRRDLNEKPDFKTSIEIKGRYDGNFFLLSVLNTSLHFKKKNKDQVFISSKRDGNEGGIGISSVDSIVKKYDGKFNIEQPEGFFKVAVAINKSN